MKTLRWFLLAALRSPSLLSLQLQPNAHVQCQQHRRQPTSDCSPPATTVHSFCRPDSTIRIGAHGKGAAGAEFAVSFMSFHDFEL
jgi:hypothetical protein